ncbi:MAG: alcohol dehydrogenase catalytic domain-containing protein [Chloroflexi bacterium]|nr:alcohol dehydrogenase catalytic domain-containing protein [Chloroflexota bacterium]
MRALVLTEFGLKLDANYPQPEPKPGEALLRLRMAGVCGTDLALMAGYKGGYRGVLGHEYVADVAAAPGNEDWVGRRVVGEINTMCGKCEHCRRGLTTHCLHRRVLGIERWDGVFADYFLSPLANLHPIPDDLPDEIAVFTEPTAAAYAALRDAPPDAGDRIVVFGDGRLGQLIAQAFRAEGFNPLLVGHHEQKLAVAARLGIRTARATPPDEEFDLAVDATGRPAALSQVLGVLRPRGTLILKSTSAQPAHLDTAAIVVHEIKIIGSRCGPFPQAIAALASGKVDPRPLIHEIFALDEAPTALRKAAEPGVLKVLIRP